jgi:hypothetical protein
MFILVWLLMLHQCAFLAPQNMFTKLKFVMIVTLFNPAMNVFLSKIKDLDMWHEKDGRSHRSELEFSASRESHENYAP